MSASASASVCVCARARLCGLESIGGGGHFTFERGHKQQELTAVRNHVAGDGEDHAVNPCQE